MWQLDNKTPFAAGQGWIRNRNGAEVWLVVVKATFDVKPDGRTVVSATQPAPYRVAHHHGEPGKSSLWCDSDFVLTKSTTDVVVVGAAHAPHQKAVTDLGVGFRVGHVMKTLRVFGDRTWNLLGPSQAEPFTTMPLVYERAFGGTEADSKHPETHWDWRNPVGCGFAIKTRSRGSRIPNIEHPHDLLSVSNDCPQPAGFGALASHWQPRAAWAGTYDKQWESTRQPLLPTDCDDRFFQSAPLDQQAPQFMLGGEQVHMANLHPQGPISFLLPLIRLNLQTTFMDGEKHQHDRPKLHTVILEAGVPRVSLVWHSALECHAKVFKLDHTRIDWAVDSNHETPQEDADPDVESLLDLL
jgi:hypothetical protein